MEVEEHRTHDCHKAIRFFCCGFSDDEVVFAFYALGGLMKDLRGIAMATNRLVLVSFKLRNSIKTDLPIFHICFS